MVRWWLLLSVCGWAGAGAGVAPACLQDQVQGPPSNPLGRFVLSISTNPTSYQPAAHFYQLRLTSVRGDKFTNFLLSLEGEGKLIPYDATTKFSDRCPWAITQEVAAPRSEVHVLWKPPDTPSGCVTFRAQVVEQRDIWYEGEGPLATTICEHADAKEEQPAVTDKCCACDEAKYEVTFEGLWSRHTHPKDFPSSNSSSPRFSEIIGASHTTQYKFWEYRGVASEGLKQLAETGSARMLESELKSHSQNIRTIIKAKGISYPNVTGKTFAVFRVNSKHHLISLVSMIDPSPDWIVGVSGLELCQENCTWVESKVLNLYPWDAGTDSGITYTSPDMPTEPRDRIRRITAKFPNDPRSPFYDPSGEEMKPLARLYLTRERLYEKSCSEDNFEYNYNEACEVTEWSDWTPCSVTCGVGQRTKQRFYKNEQRAELNKCKNNLSSRERCSAHVHCRTQSNTEFMIPPFGDENKEIEASANDPCAVTEWGKWTPCSVACGTGERNRFRALKYPRKWKDCMENRPLTQETQPCIGVDGPNCSEPMEYYKPSLGIKCEVGEWSSWSPCSVTCGKGKRRKDRVVRPSPELCPDIKTEEYVECPGQHSCRLDPQSARDVCQQLKQVGPCRGHFEKWFFDVMTQACHKFAFSGCGGNRNQFNTKEECEDVCRDLKKELIANRTARLQQFGISLTGSVISNSGSDQSQAESIPLFNLQSESHIVTGTQSPVVDCRVSEWTDWSPCSVSCGRGFKERSRSILNNNQNGGKACPKKLLRRKKCNAGSCSGRGVMDNSFEEEEDSREMCEYGEWTGWSLCSATCGNYAHQQRTRSVDLLRSPGLPYCTHRTQTRICNLPACPKRSNR